ncbi:MAG: hypothetical protein WC279_12595 [Sulfurimonas sp.]|jgi:hypothetical protein|uniref:hypothetical protein n=1 Tax=Sulfurimonas sp. TaxID=2022749 RepID=UPI0035682716
MNDPFRMIYDSCYKDEHGNNNERTPETHPYSYEGFVLYKGKGKADCTIYSDRFRNYQGYDKAVKEAGFKVSDYWNNKKVPDIERFMSILTGEPIKLVLLMQYCNMSSGYPVWRMDIRRKKNV